MIFQFSRTFEGLCEPCDRPIGSPPVSSEGGCEGSHDHARDWTCHQACSASMPR